MSCILSDLPILVQGPEGKLAANAPCIEDLDLSGNLLGDWREAERLCQELPCLHTLNLTGNLLQSCRPCNSQQYLKLRQLVLIHCGISFEEVKPFLSPQESVVNLDAVKLDGLSRRLDLSRFPGPNDHFTSHRDSMSS